MDRYQRVDKPRPETSINENEIRITTQGKMRNYITYATTLLQDKATSEIVLKAMGRAINKTVTIAEIIKRRIVSLHQNTAIGSTDITDVWEPLEEGLLPLETTRHVSMITITLSKKELDVSSTGYQPPLPADQVKPLADLEYDGDGSPRGGRGRGRGRFRGRGRGNFVTSGGYYNGGDVSWNRARGRSRGRGRGFRGRGRGYANNDAQEWGGYEDTGAAERQVGPRGRGYDDSGAGERQVGLRGRGYDDTGAGERQVGPRGRGYDDTSAVDRQVGPRGRGHDDASAGDWQVGPRGRGYEDSGAGDRQMGPRGRGYDDTGAGDRQMGPRGRGRGRGRGRARGRGRGGFRTDGSNLG